MRPAIPSLAAALALLLHLPAAAADAPAKEKSDQPGPEAAAALLHPLAAVCQAGDVPKALGKFTDDGSIRLSVEGMPDELFEGRSWIRVFWEIHSKGCKLSVGAPTAGGTEVILSNERFRALGTPQVHLLAELTPLGEKISQLHLTLDAGEAPTITRSILSNNKAVVIRFSDHINRKEDAAAIDECVASEYQQHSIMPVAGGVQGLREFYKKFRSAFPDLNYTVDDVRADGDMVMERMTVRMTHRGEFMGVAATGNPITVTKMDFWRMVSGKVVEHWDAVDRLGLLQQIGVVPKMPEWQTSPGFEGFR